MRIRTDRDRIRSLIITEPGESDHYGEMMRNFYRTEKARYPIADYAGISRREWLLRRRAILKRLGDAVGGFPKKKVPLSPHITRKTDRGDYTVETLYFYTRPNWPVSACFYLPKGAQKRLPAVLLVHGHSYAQKAAPVYQRVAVHLVKNGYAVLAVDFVGGGDRRPQGHVSRYIFTAGKTVMGIMVWDNMRAIDYLASRREVDSSRIGITGSSGGGNQTAFTTIFDERIAASCPVNAVTMYDEHMGIGCDSYCPCEVIPGLWRFAEYSDLVATVAPRPLLVVQAIKDRLFPIKGAREVYYRAREVYRAFGVPENIGLAEDYGPHSYASLSRVAVIRWFDRHLKGIEPKPFEEYEDYITAEDERSEVLCAFPGGSLPEGTITLAGLFGRFAEKLPAIARPRTRKAYVSYRRKIRAHLARLEAAPEKVSPDTEFSPNMETSWGTLRPFAFRSERGVIIPSVLAEPKDAPPSGVVICAHADGKAFTIGSRATESLVRAGAAVLAVDLRGTGETAGHVPSETSPQEGFILNRSIFLGRHISMMRAWDIRAAVRCLESIKGYEKLPVGLWGEGAAAMWALFAFAFERRIRRLVAGDLLLTFRSSQGFVQEDSIFPPHILEGADVADILAASAGRGVLLVRGRLPSGAVAKKKEVRETLAPAFDAAEILGTEAPGIVSGGFEETGKAIERFFLSF